MAGSTLRDEGRSDTARMTLSDYVHQRTWTAAGCVGTANQAGMSIWDRKYVKETSETSGVRIFFSSVEKYSVGIFLSHQLTFSLIKVLINKKGFKHESVICMNLSYFLS